MSDTSASMVLLQLRRIVVEVRGTITSIAKVFPWGLVCVLDMTWRSTKGTILRQSYIVSLHAFLLNEVHEVGFWNTSSIFLSQFPSTKCIDSLASPEYVSKTSQLSCSAQAASLFCRRWKSRWAELLLVSLFRMLTNHSRSEKGADRLRTPRIFENFAGVPTAAPRLCLVAPWVWTQLSAD